MSQAIDPRDYGALETQVKRLVLDVETLSDDVRAMRSLMEQSKGGWKTLVWLGGVAGSVGAAASWFATHIKVT